MGDACADGGSYTRQLGLVVLFNIPGAFSSLRVRLCIALMALSRTAPGGSRNADNGARVLRLPHPAAASGAFFQYKLYMRYYVCGDREGAAHAKCVSLK